VKLAFKQEKEHYELISDLGSGMNYKKKGLRKNRKVVGWPSFRSWKKKWFSLYYDEPYETQMI